MFSLPRNIFHLILFTFPPFRSSTAFEVESEKGEKKAVGTIGCRPHDGNGIKMIAIEFVVGISFCRIKIIMIF